MRWSPIARLAKRKADSIAHVLGRDMANEEDTWKVFAVASFVAFGLTGMALATGLAIV